VTDLTTETLPDGSTRICLRGVCGTVSSAHLVDVKVRQLVALWERRGNDRELIS
jgi:regulator of RNase E activity RraB